jgi:hypothetical protein
MNVVCRLTMVVHSLEGRRWGGGGLLLAPYGGGVAYKCPKHVELIYDNKLHLLHQVASSRQTSVKFGPLKHHTETKTVYKEKWLHFA